VLQHATGLTLRQSTNTLLRFCAATDLEAGPVEAKYEREYSASIDPFTAWRSKERERGRAAMALHDRMLYAAGQMVATNPCDPPVPSTSHARRQVR
jgi:hypothetical protein